MPLIVYIGKHSRRTNKGKQQRHVGADGRGWPKERIFAEIDKKKGKGKRKGKDATSGGAASSTDDIRNRGGGAPKRNPNVPWNYWIEKDKNKGKGKNENEGKGENNAKGKGRDENETTIRGSGAQQVPAAHSDHSRNSWWHSDAWEWNP